MIIAYNIYFSSFNRLSLVSDIASLFWTDYYVPRYTMAECSSSSESLLLLNSVSLFVIRYWRREQCLVITSFIEI